MGDQCVGKVLDRRFSPFVEPHGIGNRPRLVGKLLEHRCDPPGEPTSDGSRITGGKFQFLARHRRVDRGGQPVADDRCVQDPFPHHFAKPRYRRAQGTRSHIEHVAQPLGADRAGRMQREGGKQTPLTGARQIDHFARRRHELNRPEHPHHEVAARHATSIAHRAETVAST